jgi:hypothetical protein
VQAPRCRISLHRNAGREAACATILGEEDDVTDTIKDSGLLINGDIIPVPGVKVIGPHDAAWSQLSPGDCRPRTAYRNREVVQLKPQMWMLHKTIADDPEILMPGSGPPGAAQKTADYWASSPLHSGAHLVTGHEGEVACLADLWLVEAYHATVSNPYSVGHETCELVGGKFFEAAANATVQTCLVGCQALGIQLQTPKAGHYKGHPWKRMLDGGRNCIGIFGHRDNTESRGRWDPGDMLFDMLRDKGVESFDFEKEEDLHVWMDRQRTLNNQGYNLVVDGIPGPATTAALKSEGYRNGIYALGKG